MRTIAILATMVAVTWANADTLSVTILTESQHMGHDEIEAEITPTFSGPEERRIVVSYGVATVGKDGVSISFVQYDTYDANSGVFIDHKTFCGLAGTDTFTAATRTLYEPLYDSVNHHYLIEYRLEKWDGTNWVEQDTVEKLFECQ